MRKPSTSRHVYRKLDELETLVTNFVEFTLDDDKLEEVAQFLTSDMSDVDIKQIEYIVNKMNYISLEACKIQSIVDYLSKFKLNSKLEFRFNYYKELYTKCLKYANSLMSNMEN